MSLFNDFAIERFIKQEFHSFFHRSGGILLDLGCGTRPYYPHYKSKFEYCIAADRDARSVIDIQLEASRLPFRDGTIDAVLLTEVIEHLPDAERALAEVSRVLKPSGMLIISWPFNYMLHECPKDYARYTEFGMAAALARHGMRIERFCRRGNALVLWIALLEFFASGLFEVVARVPLLRVAFRKTKIAFTRLSFGTLYRVMLSCSRDWKYRSNKTVGSGLDGAYGQMAHWTLGYCCRVRKVGQGNCVS